MQEYIKEFLSIDFNIAICYDSCRGSSFTRTADKEIVMALKLWAGGIVWEKRADGLYVLVIDTENLDPRHHTPMQVRFPGGTKEDHEEYDALAVFERELDEELGLSRKDSVLPDLICTIPANKNRNSLKKVFYLLAFSDCEGKLRRGYKYDGKQKLGEPRWAKVDELINTGVIYRGHRGPLIQALRHLSLAVQ